MNRFSSMQTLAAALVLVLLAACGNETTSGSSGDGADATTNVDGNVGLGDTNSEDTGSADTGAADTANADTGGTTLDTAGDDAEDTDDALAPLCPGQAGCDCKENSDCDNALCIWTPSGKQCATKCTETCPGGQVCVQVQSGGDPVFACVSTQLTLCAPCDTDAECTQNGIEAACVDYGAEGKFCGAVCTADSDCPTDYACSDVGKKGKQCKRKPAFVATKTACTDDAGCAAGQSCKDGLCGAEAAVCGCSPWAVASGNGTTCGTSNDKGTCKAVRHCTADGLEACPAKPAVAETCNAIDDDCDGVTDNLGADATCSKKAFASTGSLAPCKVDGDCSEADEKCDTAAGACKVLIGECFGTPTCSAGGALICNDAKTPKAELCNLEDDDCDGKTDEDYLAKTPDGKEVALGEACGTGACAGGKAVCVNLTTAECSTGPKAKEETCNAADDDCDGETDDVGQVCVDGNLCTLDVCDGAAKSCSNPPAVNCDDGNPCTTESCDKAGGTCVAKFYEGSCDDGNACTVGDACGKDADGAAICLPGATTKVCDDANVCTDDACEPKQGCVGLPNAATVACYDGPAKTEGVGTCQGGYKACKEGKLTETCFTEVLPSAKELCDSQDDDCDGVTDNGCAAASAQVIMAGVAGSVSADGKTLYVRGADGAPHGIAVGDKQSVLFGWMAWVQSLFGK